MVEGSSIAKSLSFIISTCLDSLFGQHWLHELIALNAAKRVSC